MFIRSALFNIAFWLWIAIIGGLGLPIALIYRPFVYVVARGWATGSLWLLNVLCNITHEIRGAEYIPHGAALVASKHQSAWDTIIFHILLHRAAFVLKRELIFFPIFGWHLMLLKNIYINRKAGASALKLMLRNAEKRKAENRPIVIFPEGTRTAVGQSGIYHPGVAALYQHLQLPCTPVALNSGLLWKRNAFVKTPGVITIEFLPPIAPGLKSREFLKILQTQIEQSCSKLATQISITHAGTA